MKSLNLSSGQFPNLCNDIGEGRLFPAPDVSSHVAGVAFWTLWFLDIIHFMGVTYLIDTFKKNKPDMFDSPPPFSFLGAICLPVRSRRSLSSLPWTGRLAQVNMPCAWEGNSAWFCSTHPEQCPSIGPLLVVKILFWLPSATLVLFINLLDRKSVV